MSERGPWSNREDEGSIQPFVQRLDDGTGVPEWLELRRGSFTLVVLRQQAAGGKVLRSGLLGPCNPALSSNVHRRKRWSDRGVARKQRRDRTVAFGAVPSCELAAQVGRSRRGCHGSQPSRSFFDRGRPWCPKKHDGKRGRVRGHRGTRDTRVFARNGCSGVCPCVGSAVAEVVGRLPDPEKRSAASRVNIARRTAGRDGGLARSNLRQGESRVGGAAGEGAARAGNVAETHVTASRNRNRLTHERGCPPAMEGTLGRRERLIFTEGRRKRPRQSGKYASCDSTGR